MTLYKLMVFGTGDEWGIVLLYDDRGELFPMYFATEEEANHVKRELQKAYFGESSARYE